MSKNDVLVIECAQLAEETGCTLAQAEQALAAHGSYAEAEVAIRRWLDAEFGWMMWL